MSFGELALEQSIMELFQDNGYIYISGDRIHRKKRDIILADDLILFLNNKYASDELSDNEIKNILLQVNSISGTVYEANKTFYTMISEGFTFIREDSTKKDLFIKLVDYENVDNNIFKIVNQVEIEGYGNQIRRPDAIIYLNGIPIVVFEFKSAVKENATIMDAYTQLTIRYRRDIPDLFKYNAFIVISDGVNNKYGTLFSKYEYFYAWRKIESKDTEEEGINSLLTMVEGLFRKDRLLEILKDFIYFPDTSDKELKIICRYPQYFAATGLYQSVKTHMKPEGDGKGGVYFGTTGCGKSLTMLFLTRLLMKSKHFKSPTILLITDRTDLDDQLSKQFVVSKEYIGDHNVINFDSRKNLGETLGNVESGGVFLTTIQKFTENLDLLSDRNNIICISDEAHRSQNNLDLNVKISESGVKKTYGFAKYLHASLPNATYVGFTGTPVDEMEKVFGEIVERYTMNESVKDGITVNLVYEGRAAHVTLVEGKVKEIETYYAECEKAGSSDHQIEESKKAVIKIESIIGNEDRLRLLAKDFVEHYENRVREGATVEGKAMFVCACRTIAYKFYTFVKELRPEWCEKKISQNPEKLTEEEKQKLKEIAMMNLVMTRDKDDDKDLFELLGTDTYKKELNDQFKEVNSNFKIAIVVDMWLTGFDVPSLDAIYIDKPIKQHSLIQTISRVNRVYPGKDKGLIVDYFGLKKNMNEALKRYTDYENEELEGIEKAVTLVKDQFEVLSNMFYKFDNSDFFTGTPKEQLDCLNRAVEYIQLTDELEKRFMLAVKIMKQAFNLCSSSESFTEEQKELIHFYLAVRAVLYKLTRGDAPDTALMNARVREMMEEAIQADGIEVLFSVGQHIEEDIFSEEYIDKINRMTLPNTKIKVLQRLLAQAIQGFKKVNKIMAVEFEERLKKIIDDYNNRRKDEDYTKEVLEDVSEALTNLLESLKEEKNSFEKLGIDFEEKAFFDILKVTAEKYGFEYSEASMIQLARRIKMIVENQAQYTDWATRDDIKAALQTELIIVMDEYGYPPKTIDDVYPDVLEQAENFKKYA